MAELALPAPGFRLPSSRSEILQSSGSIVDRRTYTFLVASAAFLFFYLSLRAMVAPQVQQQADNQPAAEQPVDAGQEAPLAAGAAAEEPESETNAEGTSDEEGGIASTKATPEWFTLGSMDPKDPYHLLVTFSNRGAGIERIELTARDKNGRFRYRRVDTRSGYLGYFAGASADAVDGVKVNVVGPGTPAAVAVAETGEKGIQVGDVIVAVAGEAVSSDKEIRQALRETNPGDTVSVEVIRGGDEAAKTLVFKADLTAHPLDLVRLAEDGGDDQIQGNLSRLSCLMTLARVGRKSIPAGERAFDAIGSPESLMWTGSIETEPSGSQRIRFETTIGTATMSKLGGQPVRMERVYTIAPGSFLVDMDLRLLNLGDEPQDLAYRLEGPNGITLEGWWYSNKISPNFSGAAARDIVYRSEADGHELISGVKLLRRRQDEPDNPDQGIFADGGSEAAQELNYIGVDAQYFAAAYIPPGEQAAFDRFARADATVVADASAVNKHKQRAANVSFSLRSETFNVPAGAEVSQRVRMFAGPKEPELLAKYGISDFIYYGWFSFFSGILSGLLHFLQSIVGNYGVSIVLLTVIVRGCMFPLSRNAAVNAQRMQELAPEMKKIAEKYKDDMEGRLKAQQELQKRVGFNPLAGCLPMFLQLPIFMGLYRALSVDIDLRQKPLASPTGWASNLAAPDQWIFWADWMPDWIAGRGTGWLGPYLNLLPLVVVVLFITQQKLFMPPATDEQTAMTQKVMTVMTLFMGLFFFRVPAGLCIYFISSSIWGICERLLVKKTLPKGKHFNLDSDGEGDVVDAVSSKKRQGANRKGNFADKLLERVGQKEPERPVERPSKRKRPPVKKRR
jgi:YidC/Oxa1 family membrane protein insertase